MDSKTEYLQQLEEKLRTWDQRIEELRNEADTTDIQTELLERVFDKRRRIEGDVAELRNAGADQLERRQANLAASTRELHELLFRKTPPGEGSIREGQAPPPAPRRRDDEIEGGV